MKLGTNGESVSVQVLPNTTGKQLRVNNGESESYAIDIIGWAVFVSKDLDVDGIEIDVDIEPLLLAPGEDGPVSLSTYKAMYNWSEDTTWSYERP